MDSSALQGLLDLFGQPKGDSVDLGFLLYPLFWGRVVSALSLEICTIYLQGDKRTPKENFKGGKAIIRSLNILDMNITWIFF